MLRHRMFTAKEEGFSQTRKSSSPKYLHGILGGYYTYGLSKK